MAARRAEGAADFAVPELGVLVLPLAEPRPPQPGKHAVDQAQEGDGPLTPRGLADEDKEGHQVREGEGAR